MSSNEASLTAEQKNCITSFTEKNPELKPIHWTDHSIDRFIKSNYSDNFYEEWVHNVQGGESKRGTLKKWDSSRLYILNKMGGIWTDSDCTCLRGLDPLLKYDLVIIPWTCPLGKRLFGEKQFYGYHPIVHFIKL